MPRTGKPQKELVLRGLEQLAQGEHPDRQLPVERFLQCEDWQEASNLITRALDASLRRSTRGTPIAPPPGWLPPIT